jgi:shikimate kinase
MANNVPARIALIGMMGSGKTQAGLALAKLLPGYELVDLDRAIEKSLGKTISEVFMAQGEAYFRSKETDVLKNVSQRSPLILSTGGGVVLNKANAQLLRENFVCVYLKALPETVLERVGLASNRPLLKNLSEPEKLLKIKALLNERAALYQAIAHLEVQTDSQTAEGVAQQIKEKLNA